MSGRLMNAPAPPPHPPAPNIRPPRKPVAVFVCHGMGQQVHYETIEAVVNALLREQGCREAAAPPDETKEKKQPSKLEQMTQRLMARPPWAQATSRAKFVQLCGHGVMRGELTLGLDDARRDVHIYEGYWAPLTEGKIGVWQVFGFLLDAARLGIWNCLRNGGFVRFMFEKKEIFTGLHLGGLALLAALTYVILLLLIGPVVLANAFTLASVMALLFGKTGGAGISPPWISHPLITVGTWYVARIELFLLLLGLAVVILPKLYSWLQRKALILRMVGWLMRALSFALAIGSLVGAGVVAWFGLVSFARYAIQKVTGTGPEALSPAIPFPALPGMDLFHGLLQPVLRAISGWVGVPWVYLRLAIIWGLALVFGYFVRWFLIEFAGDVAIYTSGYKVSVFDQVRSAIRQTVLDAATPIYAARDGNSADASWLYENIIVVGHSLGSVIAYDTLNTLIADDLACSRGLDVVGRTRYLLTFGSPLDKTAFVFSTHSTKTHDFREKAAEEIQPLILDYADRPQQWVNIWSPMDIISGRLRYYDDKDENEGGGRRVENMWDKEAWVLFAAHTEYWQNDLFAREVYKAVLNAP